MLYVHVVHQVCRFIAHNDEMMKNLSYTGNSWLLMNHTSQNITGKCTELQILAIFKHSQYLQIQQHRNEIIQMHIILYLLLILLLLQLISILISLDNCVEFLQTRRTLQELQRKAKENERIFTKERMHSYNSLMQAFIQHVARVIYDVMY